MLELKPRNYFPQLYKDMEDVKKKTNTVQKNINTLSRLKSEFSKGKELMESIDPPHGTENPIGPNRKMNIAVAGVLGLFLGTLLTFFVEYMSKPREEEE